MKYISGTPEFNKYCREARIKRTLKKIEESKNKKRNISFPTNIDYEKPFTKVEKGFGYRGVLLADSESGEIQCHICGGFYHWLANHIVAVHKLKADQYREQFSLGYKTALCSEKVRDSLVKRAMTYPWERLNRQGQILSKMAKDHKTHKNKRDYSKGTETEEYKNKKGTCELQLFDKMEKISKTLNRQPYVEEIKEYNGKSIRGSVIRRFGSMSKMRELLEMKGYMYIPSSKQSITNKELLNSLRHFAEVYKRRPTYSDIKKGLLFGMSTYVRRFKSWSRAKELAYGQNGKTIKDYY